MSSPRNHSLVVVRTTVLVALVLALPGCSRRQATPDQSVLANVGRIPGIDASTGSIIIDGIKANLAALSGSTIGARATGNRLLMIGDSIFAGTASRYGGAMCDALVPAGWKVALEAEAGVGVSFGREVLRTRIYEGWDAAVVFLGTNNGDEARFARDFERVIDSLAPRPTLVLTATMYSTAMEGINRQIRLIASRYPHVSVLDWSTASAQPGMLTKDGVHPSAAGRAVLVASVASALGNAPTGPGACLPVLFSDDSRVVGALPSTTVDPLSTTTLPVDQSTSTVVTTTLPPTTSTQPAG